MNNTLKIAANMWWREKGEVTVRYIANQFSVDLNDLTLLIQDQISEIAGIEIYDQSPQVEVQSTVKQMEATHINHGSIRNYSIFYAMKYPQRFENQCYLMEV
jgi:hypothetical protein